MTNGCECCEDLLSGTCVCCGFNPDGADMTNVERMELYAEFFRKHPEIEGSLISVEATYLKIHVSHRLIPAVTDQHKSKCGTHHYWVLDGMPMLAVLLDDEA